jgi:ribosomal protein S18 acetylase RimI-like enzyme
VNKKLDIYKQVARLHIASLDQGFLSTLGSGFLTELYRSIDKCPQAVLIVKCQQGEVIGFVTGVSGPMTLIYRRMMLRFPLWAWRLFPIFFSPKRLGRIIEILRYVKSNNEQSNLPISELLSIALTPNSRGKGIADAMYGDLIKHFREMKVERFKIVVGDGLTPAHKFYQRMGAKVVAETEIHHGVRSAVYVQNVRQ